MNPSLVDVEAPTDHVIRRGLMNIAKIVQNLANNIFFGKEVHMIPLNDFLSANIVNITRYLSEVNVWLSFYLAAIYADEKLSRNIRRQMTIRKNGWTQRMTIRTSSCCIGSLISTQTKLERSY